MISFSLLNKKLKDRIPMYYVDKVNSIIEKNLIIKKKKKQKKIYK